MKKVLLFLAVLVTSVVTAQNDEEIKIIEENTGLSYEQAMKIYVYKDFVKDTGDALVVLDSIHIKKGDDIQIYLPTYDKDFYFVEQKKGLLNAAKIAGAAAEVVGTGAVAVGLGSGNISTLSKSLNVLQKTSAIKYGTDAIDKVDKLPISKKAKRIAGKKMEVLEWENDNGVHVITAQLGKKKYLIELENAYIIGEVKL